MRLIIPAAGALALATLVSGCASTGDRWADACRRDYERNRAAAAAAGALVGGAAGAAIDENDARGAAIGAAVGGLLGSQLANRDDPCGYGFSGYPYDPRYGYWDERRGRWRR